MVEKSNSAGKEQGIFEPLAIGNLKLPGRLAKSATVETRCTTDGYVTDELIQFYREIAEGGTPLIITGASSYCSYSRGVPKQISVDADDKIEGLRHLADTVHRAGSRIVVQLFHTGRQAVPELVGRTEAVSASAVYEPTLGVMPRAMSLAEIQDTIAGFAAAALRCKQAGMDGIQIHAAHGYLISAFLTPHTNRRHDAYGGSFDNRLRLLLEIYRAVREKVGTDYPVILKLNGSDDLRFRRGLKLRELVEVAKRLEREGIDAVEITAGHYESGMTFQRGNWRGFISAMLSQGMGSKFSRFRRVGMSLIAPLVDSLFNALSAYRSGFNRAYAREFTKALNIPVICVGGMADRATMDDAIFSGDCDMVSVARGLIADPHLYSHMQQGIAGPECDNCNGCIARAGAMPLACYNPAVVGKIE